MATPRMRRINEVLREVVGAAIAELAKSSLEESQLALIEKAGLKPPTTWDEYLADAKALNGKDFGGRPLTVSEARARESRGGGRSGSYLPDSTPWPSGDHTICEIRSRSHSGITRPRSPTDR